MWVQSCSEHFSSRRVLHLPYLQGFGTSSTCSLNASFNSSHAANRCSSSLKLNARLQDGNGPRNQVCDIFFCRVKSRENKFLKTLTQSKQSSLDCSGLKVLQVPGWFHGVFCSKLLSGSKERGIHSSQTVAPPVDQYWDPAGLRFLPTVTPLGPLKACNSG